MHFFLQNDGGGGGGGIHFLPGFQGGIHFFLAILQNLSHLPPRS